MRADLHREHQPRPWSCSSTRAVFCTIHGDCTCQPRPAQRDDNCPLHGACTAHGKAAPLLIDRPFMVDGISLAAALDRSAV